MKKRYDKQNLRAAQAICGRIARRRAIGFSPTLPRETWARLERLARQLRRAQERQWHAAARETADSLIFEARCLQGLAAVLGGEIQQESIGQPDPSAWDVYREIEALYCEFDEVAVDAKTGMGSVTIGPIELEGIDLGRFEVRLDWIGYRGGAPYRVMALDPNPPAGRDDVTHPHVQDEQLCEGEGRAAIRAALSQGRLLDFFQIVARTLETHARGAAYVEMDRWGGETCHDCGRGMHEDDCTHCGRCGEPLCGDCDTMCPQCENNFCSDCTGTCHACESMVCSYCIQRCSDCGQLTCDDCLENDLCEDCHEKRKGKQDHAGVPTSQSDHDAAGDDEEAEPEKLVHAA